MVQSAPFRPLRLGLVTFRLDPLKEITPLFMSNLLGGFNRFDLCGAIFKGTEFLRFCWFDFSDVTADVELFFFRAIFTVELSVKGVNGNQAGLNTWLDFKNYCMHPVYWTILIRSWEKFLTPDSTGYDVADQRISFW